MFSYALDDTTGATEMTPTTIEQYARSLTYSELQLRMLAARYCMGERITQSQYDLLRLHGMNVAAPSYRWERPNSEAEVSMKHWGDFRQ